MVSCTKYVTDQSDIHPYFAHTSHYFTNKWLCQTESWLFKAAAYPDYLYFQCTDATVTFQC